MKKAIKLLMCGVFITSLVGCESKKEQKTRELTWYKIYAKKMSCNNNDNYYEVIENVYINIEDGYMYAYKQLEDSNYDIQLYKFDFSKCYVEW